MILVDSDSSEDETDQNKDTDDTVDSVKACCSKILGVDSRWLIF